MVTRIYDLEGNMLQDYETRKEMYDTLKLSDSAVSICIKGGSNYTGNYQIREGEKDKLPLKVGDVSMTNSSGRAMVPVAKYWNGRLVATYSTISEASTKNKMNPGFISLSMSRDRAYKGFTFKEMV